MGASGDMFAAALPTLAVELVCECANDCVYADVSWPSLSPREWEDRLRT